MLRARLRARIHQQLGSINPGQAIMRSRCSIQRIPIDNLLHRVLMLPNLDVGLNKDSITRPLAFHH